MIVPVNGRWADVCTGAITFELGIVESNEGTWEDWLGYAICWLELLDAFTWLVEFWLIMVAWDGGRITDRTAPPFALCCTWISAGDKQHTLGLDGGCCCCCWIAVFLLISDWLLILFIDSLVIGDRILLSALLAGEIVLVLLNILIRCVDPYMSKNAHNLKVWSTWIITKAVPPFLLICTSPLCWMEKLISSPLFRFLAKSLLRTQYSGLSSKKFESSGRSPCARVAGSQDVKPKPRQPWNIGSVPNTWVTTFSPICKGRAVNT